MSDIELVPNRYRGPDHRPLPTIPASPEQQRADYRSSADGKTNETRDIEDSSASSVPLLPACLQVSSHQSNRDAWLVTFSDWLLLILVPVVAVAYLIFCYVVHYRVVTVGFSTDATSQFLTNLGAGITTINIIIISFVMVPLKRLLSDLQSEEFFRLLGDRKNRRGVPLSTINGISNSSYALIEALLAIAYRVCSSYYVMAFFAAGIIWAVSTLAPAALSIQPILIDGEIMAFPVGSIPPLSLYQPAAAVQTVTPDPPPGYAAAIAWAERQIGLSYSFSASNDSSGEFAAFVVPTPANLNSTVSARWLTDVIGFNPYCTWANPANLTATSANATMNSTQMGSLPLSVHLTGLNLQVSIPQSYFPVYNSRYVTRMDIHDTTATVFNYTTGNLPTDGAMVMSVIQCTTGCTGQAINIISLFVNFTGIPSMTYTSIGATYELGFLVCKPNITIETREVRTQGSMVLEVQPRAATPYPQQGNLDWTQTSLFTSYALSLLTSDSGPQAYAWLGLGSVTQVDWIFGQDQMNNIPLTVDNLNTSRVLNPLPLDQLVQGYKQIVTASMKPYVTGMLGTTYVPGRVAGVQHVFVSSMPHVVASTILFAVLLALAIFAHFRHGKGDQFNLTNVAAALADSDIPQLAKQVKLGVIAERGERRRRKRWWEKEVGDEVVSRIGDKKVYLKRDCADDAGVLLTCSSVKGSEASKD